MPTVTREIHIDAPPDVVRRRVADPSERRSWLDDARTDHVPSDGRTLEYPSSHGDGQVRIEVVPDGDGTRVRVTEEVELPGERTLEVVEPVDARPRATGDSPVALAA